MAEVWQQEWSLVEAGGVPLPLFQGTNVRGCHWAVGVQKCKVVHQKLGAGEWLHQMQNRVAESDWERSRKADFHLEQLLRTHGVVHAPLQLQ